ncbi:MAG: hypothetical protein ACJAXK_001174 [Yoonia sp.]|jgi:hypothetical protein
MKDERQAAVSAVLEGGHIPAGMELFSSGNETQLETIRRWIDNSDVYLLILGGRYGSIEPNSGKSYIEIEFDQAVAQGKSLFSIVINEAALEAKTKKMGLLAIERKNGESYEIFRSRVLSKTSGFYDDAKDIKLEILKSLKEKSDDVSLLGWMRGSAKHSDQHFQTEREDADLLNGFKQSDALERYEIEYPAMPSVSERIEIEIESPSGGYGGDPIQISGSWAEFFPLFAASLQANFSDWDNEFFFAVRERESREALAASILGALKSDGHSSARVTSADFERLQAYFIEAGLMFNGIGREPFTETGQKLARRVKINILDFGKRLTVSKGKLPNSMNDEIPF